MSVWADPDFDRSARMPIPMPGCRKGVVYLVGAGPGDAGLMTLRAASLIGSCNVLVYDALVPKAALEMAPAGSELIYAGKRGSEHSVEQPEINALLAAKASEGKSVVRLKGGDPFVFGRGGEEAEYLAERGIPFEVVPGVTAGIAAPAYAGIPITYRGVSSAAALITGHEDPSKPASGLDYSAIARIGTACFYMGASRAAEICAELSRRMSQDTPAAAISNATLPTQRAAVGTLRDLPERMERAGVSAPAIIVIGDVVRFSERLGWLEKRPLHGRTVIVTRAADDAPRMAAAFEALGARALPLPTIRIEPPDNQERLDRAARKLADFDWVVFTSVHGVHALIGALERGGLDARAFGRAKVAAIGPATAEALARSGIRADIVPSAYKSEAMLAEFARLGFQAGARFLLARADIAGPELARGLRDMGAAVEEVAAYRTVPEMRGGEEAVAAIESGYAHWVAFTSASTARFFAARIGPERLERLRKGGPPLAASIGPATSAALRELGIEPSAEAAEHTIRGLVEAVWKAEKARDSMPRNHVEP